MGPLLPVFRSKFTGEIIDGRRRLEICERHGLKIATYEVSRAQTKPLLWMLHPETCRRDEYSHPDGAKQAATDFWSEPATIAAFWLESGAERTGTTWNRLAKSFDNALSRERQGLCVLTARDLVAIVRREGAL